MASSAVAGTWCEAIISAGECAYLVPLHLTVLEFAQTVLQTLQVPDGPLVGLRVVERGEELQQVTQFLAPLPQVMQALRRRVRGDRPALAQHPAVSVVEPVGGDRRDRLAPAPGGAEPGKG